MRLVFCFITIALVVYSCDASRKSSRYYYYVEPFKEQEVELYFRSDSTFTLRDRYGCVQFRYDGKYREIVSRRTFIFDSVVFREIMATETSERFFVISNGDTATIINEERLIIHHVPFVATSKRKVDLQEIRYKKIKEFYTNLLGQKGFFKEFGGKGDRAAKKQILDCRVPEWKVVK